VFDINKCIACQTCTLACKTTWTSGKGQEYMLWNNVESKPYGFDPLAWDFFRVFCCDAVQDRAQPRLSLTNRARWLGSKSDRRTT
jgi:nitrate reductase beta subunit